MASINEKLVNRFSSVCAAALAVAIIGGAAFPAMAQQTVPQPINPAQAATYADLVTLADRSDLVIRAEIRRQTVVEPERAPGLAPGFARLYIEAETLALISGSSSLGESLTYLVDVPLNGRKKPAKMKGREVILFADPVAGRRGSIRLVGKNGQLDYSPALEARLRPVLTELVSNNAPPVVTGLRDALAVPGTLTGESETQIFLTTQNRSPVSISVLRRPGQRPVWGVSWGEIIDSSAKRPQPDTLRWYRLACSLPARLPSNANLARDPAARAIAEDDYLLVVNDLGRCDRAISEVF